MKTFMLLLIVILAIGYGLFGFFSVIFFGNRNAIDIIATFLLGLLVIYLILLSISKKLFPKSQLVDKLINILESIIDSIRIW